jgi:hypothetical protein
VVAERHARAARKRGNGDAASPLPMDPLVDSAGAIIRDIGKELLTRVGKNPIVVVLLSVCAAAIIVSVVKHRPSR